jgi:hypothetical protein
LTGSQPRAALPDAGVISDARRRQRRRRAGVAVALAAIAATAFLRFSTARTTGPLRVASSLARLAGPPLSASTRLQLVVSPPSSGPVELVDVDSRRVRVVPGLGLPLSAASAPAWGPSAWLTATAGGARAVVSHQACGRCSATQTAFLIGYGGSVRRLASQPLTPQQQSAPALGSTSTWLLTWPHRGGSCTLRLVPGARRAVVVPCGYPQAESPAGVVLSRQVGRGSAATLVDPLTGRVRARAPQLVPLSGQLVLAMSDPQLLSCQRVRPRVLRCSQSFRQRLTLLDLSSGTKRPVSWPGAPTGFALAGVFPAPHGSLAAVEFVDAVTAGAADIWLLDTRTGRFTHLPGFPALENVLASSVSWAGDGRLVVVSETGAHVVVGVWRPEQPTMPVHPLPALAGYSSVMPAGYANVVPLIARGRQPFAAPAAAPAAPARRPSIAAR